MDVRSSIISSDRMFVRIEYPCAFSQGPRPLYPGEDYPMFLFCTTCQVVDLDESQLRICITVWFS